MALETHIHGEVTEYKARILGDFSGRQLIAMVGTLAVVVISYIIFVVGLKLSMDWYPFVAMLLCAPILLFGFKKQGKLSFEKYVQLIWRHYFGNNKLSWQAESVYSTMPIENENAEPRKKGAKKNVKRKTNTPEETEGYCFGGKKEIKAARKRIQREIKKAKRSHDG